jgi:acetyl-CoA carboxylase biotin carboxylase subunit
MKQIKKILVANRGEIAVRILRTCREMGLGTVAVFSDADAAAPHRLYADESAALGLSDPQESYLAIDKIIEAAGKTGADAIHPGYGFLAENPVFAERCEAEGIVFIGPPADAIRAMGDKVYARNLASKCGVPLVPGTAAADPASLLGQGEKIGFPLIVKAASGGGGKGMRIVSRAADLEEALTQAEAEARKAFGDGSIYLEKYLESPRHVEIQVLADSHGRAVHLHERECSIQRRYQKIIEESPSPIVDDAMRQAMTKAALALVKAAGYVNAGTVEFLVDPGGAFYFLEMNTRIQVEHTVTEMRTGLDLVRKQIEIAAGENLGLEQKDIAPRGHAIECRVYAEDPENDFLPSPGKIELLEEPAGSGVRVDSGIRQGMTIPVEYDPVLSKVVVAAESRGEAIDRMIRALHEYAIVGLRTTIPLMIDVLDSKPFRQGNTNTGFMAEHFPDWKPSRELLDLAVMAFVTHDLKAARSDTAVDGEESDRFKTPWQTLGSWRM